METGGNTKQNSVLTKINPTNSQLKDVHSGLPADFVLIKLVPNLHKTTEIMVMCDQWHNLCKNALKVAIYKMHNCCVISTASTLSNRHVEVHQ